MFLHPYNKVKAFSIFAGHRLLGPEKLMHKILTEFMPISSNRLAAKAFLFNILGICFLALNGFGGTKPDLLQNPPPAPASCPTPIAGNVILCAPGEVSLTATGAISPTQTYKWYASASGGEPIGTGSPFLFNATVSTSLFVAIADTNCEGSRDEVIITLTSNPPGPATTNGSTCGPGSVTLTALSSLPNPVYEWYDSPFDGNLVFTGSSYSVNLSTVSDTFFVRVVAGACSSSRTLAIARIKSVPPSPIINDTTRCGAGSVTLAPIVPQGATVKWYADSLPATPAFFVNTLFTTPVFSDTVFYYISTLLQGCESAQRVKVNVFYNMGPPISGAQDVARCLPGVFELTASTVAGGTIHWYDSASGGSQLFTGNTFSTTNLSQSTSYWVSASDAGGCEGARQEVKALIVAVPEPPLGADAFRCGPGVVSLSVQPIPGFIAQWYTAEIGGSPFFSGSVFTTPDISSDAVYFVSASIPGCESGRREIKAMVKPIPAALPSDTSDRCEPGQLILNSGTAEKTRWYADEQATQFLAESSNLTVTLSESKSYYIRVKDSLTSCESPVSMHFAKLNSVEASASPASIIAGETSILSCNSGLSFSWEPASTLNASNVRSPQARPSVSTLYRVTVVYESGCSLSDTVTISVTASEIPNVFTPNGDKIFDTWEIPGAVKNTGNKLMVFNRWGSIVKEESGYKNDWDGGDLPAGTYYYRYDEGTGKPVLSGTITIVK